MTSLPSPSGILLLDKPSGPTSHDVVLRARRALGLDRIGHSGTLDPMATGLLILLVGPATRFQERFQGLPKVYSGTARLGLETDTGDRDGKVVRESPAPTLDAEALGRELQKWIGPKELPPPRYSAVKVKGKPMYAYARKGVTVEAKPRIQNALRWELLGWEPPEFRFRMECASGTYVRSLVEALGNSLGCGACLTSLRRESIGAFRIEDALTPEAFEALAPAQRLACLADPRKDLSSPHA